MMSAFPGGISPKHDNAGITSARKPAMRRDLINLLLLLFFTVIQLFQLFALPIWLLPQSPAWGYALLLPALLTTSWWAFIHESIHGCLFSNKPLNKIAGRMHAILFGSPFDLLRWGHLLHHAYSRTERERPEVYMPGSASMFWCTFNYYFRLLGGLYLFEVVGGMLLLLPRFLIHIAVDRFSRPDNVVDLLSHKIMAPHTLAMARVEAVFILLVYGCAFSLYGEYAWMLAGALLLRGCLISLVDNVFHYETPLEQIRYAHNLYLPAWWSRLILHFNLHGIHHLQPNASCWQLPGLHAESGHQYQGHWMKAITAQFKGPVSWHALKD
jgi:fatty acid desaturase